MTGRGRFPARRLVAVGTAVAAFAALRNPAGRAGRADRPSLPSYELAQAAEVQRAVARPRPTVAGRLPARRLLAVVTAVAALAGTLSWPQPSVDVPAEVALLRLARGAPADGPVAITGIRTALLWTGPSTPEIAVDVANRSDHRVEALVWWLLAVPGDRQPWRHPVSRSVPVALSLSAGAHRAVQTPSPARLPAAGSYALSAWVHARSGGGGFIPADGVALAATVVVNPGSMQLRHRVALGSALTVERIELPESVRAGTAVEATVTVANKSLRPLAARTWLTLTAPDGTTTLSSTVDVIVDAATTRLVPLRFHADRDPGPNHVIATVQLVQPGGFGEDADVSEFSRPLFIFGRGAGVRT